MRRRFNVFSYKERYGLRLQRLTLDGGFACPNRDGTLGAGGCTFCDNAAFHPAYTHGKSIFKQIDAGIEFHQARGRKADGYLAYFQAYSNTYAPLSILKERYEEALSHPNIKGLVIGTRPDCVDSDNEAAFGIGIIDHDRLSVLGGKDVARQYGFVSDGVFGEAAHGAYLDR